MIIIFEDKENHSKNKIIIIESLHNEGICDIINLQMKYI